MFPAAFYVLASGKCSLPLFMFSLLFRFGILVCCFVPSMTQCMHTHTHAYMHNFPFPLYYIEAFKCMFLKKYFIAKKLLNRTIKFIRKFTSGNHNK